jgi:hypothetical protein
VILEEEVVVIPYTKLLTWHHYNWGYIGGMNGYYNAGVFGAGSMVANSDGTAATGGCNYTGGTIWTDIRRPILYDPPIDMPPIDRSTNQ